MVILELWNNGFGIMVCL